MDRDANYVAVGAFVLLVIAMAVSFVFWYTDQQDKRTYQRYEIYFPGSGFIEDFFLRLNSKTLIFLKQKSSQVEITFP